MAERKRVPAVYVFQTDSKLTLGKVDFSKGEYRTVTELGDGTYKIEYSNKKTGQVTKSTIVLGRPDTVLGLD